jgi:hypothetical protein
MTGAASAAACFFYTSCTTAYDSYGRPIQSVDPGAAVAGAAAAGIIGYSLGHNDDHSYRRGGYYRGGYYYHGGYYDRPPRTYYRRY